MSQRELAGSRHALFALLIHAEGENPFSKNSSVSLFLLDELIAREVGTKAPVMRHCGGPNQALHASRSGPLQR